jgi:nickel/cobalt exporter
VAGLIPCPLTLFIMVTATARGVPEAGLTFAIAMMIGVGLTLSLVAILTLFGRDWMLAIFEQHGHKVARISRVLDALAGGLLVVIAGRELLR